MLTNINYNSDNRDKWVINELSILEPGIKIIDCGAGECKYKQYCSHLDYVSQDFCEYKGNEQNTGLQTGVWDTSKIDIVSDITCIPVENESFDVVLCTEVFEHIPHPELALKEFYRILKKGGKLILTAPFASLTHFAPYHYCTGFNKYWYEYHFKENNFEINKIEANGNYYRFMIQEMYRLMGNHRCRYNIFMRIGGKLVLLYLNKQIQNNNEEFADLCCFGYHIVAKKG